MSDALAAEIERAAREAYATAHRNVAWQEVTQAVLRTLRKYRQVADAIDAITQE